jgi:hypothetical protein
VIEGRRVIGNVEEATFKIGLDGESFLFEILVRTTGRGRSSHSACLALSNRLVLFIILRMISFRNLLKGKVSPCSRYLDAQLRP